MKFCKDCKHFRAPAKGVDVNDYAKCVFGLELSPVTGRHEIKTQSSLYAIGCRQSNIAKDCGPDARHFTCGRFLAEDDEVRCGDEGRMCETCAQEREAEHSWMRGQSKGACTGILSEDDKQDIRDAGRGHLV